MSIFILFVFGPTDVMLKSGINEDKKSDWKIILYLIGLGYQLYRLSSDEKLFSLIGIKIYLKFLSHGFDEVDEN